MVSEHRKDVRNPPRRATVVALALAASLAASTAYAQPAKGPNAADRETARTLMDEGRTKAGKKDFNGALAAYKAADAIMHVPTTGLAVARTQATLGQLVEARDTALGVARIPAVAGEPAIIGEGRKQAEDLANELAPRIPTLKISIVVPTGVTPDVTVDDVAVAYEALIAPRKVNPGHHVVVAKVGTVERRAESDLVEKESKAVTLEFPANLKPVPVPVAATPASAPPTTSYPREPEKKGTSPLVYIGIGVGAAGLITGLGAGFYSYSKVDSAKESCRDSRCPASTHADLDTATTMGTVSNIGFIVAGAGAGVLVLGLLMGGSRTEAPSSPRASAVQARPVVGPGHVGMVGEF